MGTPLWYDFLRDFPVHIYRQKTIGNYILDFYCARAKLAIELDGSGHCYKGSVKHDELRTFKLNEIGIDVVRYYNNDIDKNFEAVCEDICRQINSRLKK